MKDYVPKKQKDVSLEPTLYLRVLHTVRDYPRMKQEVDEVLYGSSNIIGICKVTKISKPTENKAILIAETEKTIDAIDKALSNIPIEYRHYIFENVVYKIGCPDYAARNTWSLWRTRFLYAVALNLKWV